MKNSQKYKVPTENAPEDTQYYELQIQDTDNLQRSGNTFSRKTFLFKDFHKYREYLLQRIGTHDTGDILRQFKKEGGNNEVVFREKQDKGDQQPYAYDSIIFQQLDEKRGTQSIHSDFRTYYYEQSKLKAETAPTVRKASNLDSSSSSSLISSRLKQQTLNIYEGKVQYFQSHYKFKKYMTGIYGQSIDFCPQELSETKFYYNQQEQVLHFIETLNNQNYNRVLLSSINKAYFFSIAPPVPIYLTFQPDVSPSRNTEFYAIRYSNKLKAHSVIMLQVSSEEIRLVIQAILAETGIQPQNYNQEKFIQSKENSFEAEGPQQLDNQKKVQERKQQDRSTDQAYEDYLNSQSQARDEQMRGSKMKPLSHSKKMSSFNHTPNILISNYSASPDLTQQYATPTLLNQEQLDKLQTQEKLQRHLDTSQVPPQQQQLQGFIQQQLIKQGYKIVTPNKTLAPDGFYYNLEEFKQNPDGYIYGPKVQMQTHENKEVETVVEQKVAPGILQQNHEGHLFGPDGQNYGDRDQVMQIQKISSLMASEMAPTRKKSNESADSKVSVNDLSVSVIQNPEAENRHEFQTHLQESVLALQKGVIFIKYGSTNYFSGSKRKVFVDPTLKYICWTDHLQTDKIVTRAMNKDGKGLKDDDEREQEEKKEEKKIEKKIEKQEEKKIEKQGGLENIEEENIQQTTENETNKDKANSDDFLKKSVFADEDDNKPITKEKDLLVELFDGKNRPIKKLFEIKRILQIVNGRETKNFKRFSTKDQSRIECSFSILVNQRSIDLEATTSEDKQSFLKALIFLINNVDFLKMEQNNPLTLSHINSTQPVILKRK